MAWDRWDLLGLREQALKAAVDLYGSVKSGAATAGGEPGEVVKWAQEFEAYLASAAEAGDGDDKPDDNDDENEDQ